jgi:hypothetical protein
MSRYARNLEAEQRRERVFGAHIAAAFKKGLSQGEERGAITNSAADGS